MDQPADRVPWAERIRLGAAVLCLAGAGAAGGYVLSPEPVVRAAPAVEVRVGGLAANPEARPADEARRLAGEYLAAAVVLDAGPHSLVHTREALGLHVDVERLEALLGQAFDPRSVMRRSYARTGREELGLPMPTTLDHGRAEELLLDLKDRVDRAPVDARIDTKARQPVRGRHGRRLDVWATLDALAEGGTQGATRLPAIVAKVPARRTFASLRGASMDVLLGSFETPYDARDTAADRTHNLRVAAEKIDGLVLLPGETFDFNGVVGDRNEANGFRPAPVIAGGELVDGVGGGACQVAGTLHAAAFFAGLPILERHPHSRPSSYIKLGLDAAVSYPKLNFRFENDLPFPVVLELEVEGGTMRAGVWGKSSSRMVSFVRRIEEAHPFEEKVTEDDSLPEGVRVVTQRGVPGFKLSRWRIVRDLDTNQAVRTAGSDTYPPTSRVVRVGTGPPAAEGYEPPEGDTHPEYVADEFLTMTQGPGIDGTLERKRQGRYGTYGWTEREGLTPEAHSGAAK